MGRGPLIARVAVVAFAIVGGIAGVFGPASFASAAEDCIRPNPVAVQGVATLGAVGVIERKVVAANPLPWGRAVAIATRVWGPPTVERFRFSNRGACTEQWSDEVGTYFYRTADRIPLVPLDPGGEVNRLEAGILATEFGEPRVLPITSGDTLMAWIRVFPGVIASILAILIIAGRLLLRRRRRPRERYLF